MKRTIGIMMICLITSITSNASAESAVELTVDSNSVIGTVPVNFFSACKYGTDSLLQDRVKEAEFSLIRIDAMLDGIERDNDDNSPSHFNWEGFQWGDGAGQYGSNLDESVRQIIANGHKPFIILHRTQEWNAKDDWRSVPMSIDEWAEAAAATVYHFNKELKAGIAYWEIWNEPNGSYEWAGSFDEYLEVARAAAERMKAVDPTIEVGGPALSHADLGQMQKVIKRMWDVFDFYSWHAYGTGGDDSGKITDAALLAQTGIKYGNFAKQLRSAIERYDKSGRKKELILSEFNIDWANSAMGEQRRTGVVNAVWTMSVLGHLLKAGVDVTSIFSLTECSILGDGINPLPVFDAYTLVRSHIGDQVIGTESGSRDIEVIATADAKKVYIWIINKAENDRTVTLKLRGVPSSGIGSIEELPRLPAKSTMYRYSDGEAEFIVPKTSITIYEIPRY